MLEQLQHLQQQVQILVKHVQDLQQKQTDQQHIHAQTAQNLQRQLDDARSALQEAQDQQQNTARALTQGRDQHQQLQQEHQTLSDKYRRLENSCNELRKRFEALITQKNQLKSDYDNLGTQNESLQSQLKELGQVRDQLHKKNEQARQKVEAIIQRLAILGTAQDSNSLSIQQLAHPHAEQLEFEDSTPND